MEHENHTIEYLLNHVLTWYQQADMKAQVAISITGVVLAIFIPGSLTILAKTNIANIVIVIVLILLLLSLIFSFWAIYSRGMNENKQKSATFFGYIANFDTSKEYSKALDKYEPAEISKELINEIYHLSKNTKTKHILINLSWFSLSLAFVIMIIFFAVFILFK